MAAESGLDQFALSQLQEIGEGKAVGNNCSVKVTSTIFQSRRKKEGAFVPYLTMLPH